MPEGQGLVSGMTSAVAQGSWGAEVRARRDARGWLGLLCSSRAGCIPSTFSTLLGNMPRSLVEFALRGFQPLRRHQKALDSSAPSLLHPSHPGVTSPSCISRAWEKRRFGPLRV